MNKLLIVVILLLLAVLAVASFIAWQLWSNKNTVKQIPQVSQISPTPSPSPNLKKIAYMKNGAMWIINSDGTNKKQLLQSSGDINYKAPSWKNTNELSYVRCDVVSSPKPNCVLETQNLLTNNISTDAKPGNSVGEVGILALGWNHAGNQLAYIYELPDGQMKLDFKTNGVNNTVKNFFAGPGRGGSLDDDVSIYFSPDDKHVLVTNTLTTGNPQEKNTIWVFDSSGKEILAIPIAENGWPTQAQWWGGSGEFIYKQGTELASRELIEKNGTSMSTITSFYNPIPNPLEGNYIPFWKNTSTLPELWSWQAGSPPVVTKILDGYFKPQSSEWKIIAIKAQKAPGKEIILPFVSVGLSSIDAKSKTATDLDSGEINEFAISP